jgi:hypothetical protein
VVTAAAGDAIARRCDGHHLFDPDLVPGRERNLELVPGASRVVADEPHDRIERTPVAERARALRHRDVDPRLVRLHLEQHRLPVYLDRLPWREVSAHEKQLGRNVAVRYAAVEQRPHGHGT